MSIGDEAEDLVQLWGTRAGFTVNPIRRDRFGWDHLFEMRMPNASDASDPLGLPTCAFSCRIQVKAIVGDKQRAPVKLSNWERAAQDPLPWFFVILRFTPKRFKLNEAVLVHVGKQTIENVVERLYSLPKADKEHLHKRSLGLDCRTGIRLAPPFQRSLSRALRAQVGEDLFEYAKAKRSWYEEAGYTDRNTAELKVSLKSSSENDLYSQLARAAVGLSNGLDIYNVSLCRERFGMSESLPGFANGREGKGKLAITRPPYQEGWKLSVIDASGSCAAVLLVSIRVSTSVFPMLPEEFLILRAQALLIDLTIDKGTRMLSAKIDIPTDGEVLPLKALRDSLEFLSALHQCRGQEVQLQLERGSRALTIGHARPVATLGRNGFALSASVRSFWALVCQLGIADQPILVDLESVRRANTAVELMLGCRTGDDRQLFIETMVAKSSFDPARSLAFVTNPSVLIGSATYLDLVMMKGQPEILVEHGETVRIRVCPLKGTMLRSYRYVGRGVHKFDFQAAALAAQPALLADGNSDVIAIEWGTLSAPNAS